MGDALEAEAQLQESGLVSQLGNAFDPTYAQILAVAQDYDNAVAFAFTFWDSWIDCANHDWRHHATVREDWPRFAREISTAVRAGRLPDNPLLIERISLKPSRTLRQWFLGLFHRGV